MGQHRTNPRALAAARAVPFRMAPKEPDVEFGFSFQVVVEPNLAKKAEIQAEVERLKAAGEPVPTEFEITMGDQDLVVYKAMQVLRRRTPGGVDLPDGRHAVTTIRGEEFFRTPMSEVLSREGEQLEKVFGRPSVIAEG